MAKALKPLTIVLGLLLLLTYFFVESRSPEPERRARMQEALQTLQLYEAQLTRDLLLARAGLLANYDSFSRIGRELAQTIEALRADSAAISGAAANGIESQVEALWAALKEKLTLVEYFKSDNALLQNSLRYFSHTGQKIGKETAGQWTAGEAVALSHAILRFIHTPEPGAGREAEAALQRLSRAAPRQGDVAQRISHGWLIIKMLPQVDTLLGQIIASPSADHADAVQESVLQYASRSEKRAQVFRALLYLTAVLLLGYLLYQFGRLRANASDLRRANAELQREMAERQQVVIALRASEERFRAITESANDAIISADSAGNVVSWNAKATAIFGYTESEILGSPFARLLPTRHERGNLQRFRDWLNIASSRPRGTTVELLGARKNGSEFPLEISLSTWSSGNGNYMTGIIRDLTAQKELQETTRQQELQLIQANKMTALGTLVSGVAHEINNPNQAVLMNAKILGEAWKDASAYLDDYAQERGGLSLAGLPYDEMRRAVPTLTRDIHDGARRIERIIDDLKHFSRPRARGAGNRLNLNDALERALRLLSHLIKSRTDHLNVELARPLPDIIGDEQHVEQIAVNLLTNAVEALPDKNRCLAVTTSFDAAAGAVVLKVRDEGTGIAAEHLVWCPGNNFTRWHKLYC
jgi:PAS domain S-box-containing protein